MGAELEPNAHWGRIRGMRPAGIALAVSLIAGATLAILPATHEFVAVVVRARAGAERAAALAVQEDGGRIGRALPIVDGFAATVPARAISALRTRDPIASITPDAGLHLLHMVDGYDPTADPGSIGSVTDLIRAQDAWSRGYTGAGVDIALIDSGVAPVNGLTAPGKIVNGPDLSFESQSPDLRYLDTFGHGTHMAGIMAGRDDAATRSTYTSHENFVGVAPDARIVSIKVADATGATDVSQVIAAIDWVVQHRNDNGLNIRVLNLSFGTDGAQDYTLDPLAYAVEVAWRKGIFVVVAAGNGGTSLGRLNDPARDPYVLAVGADDPAGTARTGDDTIPTWSSRGDGTRNPDIVAPGKSVESLRDPGSYIDQRFPEGRINGRFFRGSGTSQATAVMSGVAALLIGQRPELRPGQLKKLLMSTATPIQGYDTTAAGAGLVNVKAAATGSIPAYSQSWQTSSGTGSLEGARGSAHVTDANGNTLTGERDIFGTTWSGTTWSANAWAGTTWSGGDWNGTTWSGNCWCGSSWSGTTWSGTTWSGTTWSGTTWSGTTWSGAHWDGTTWSGTTWSGTTWSGTTWSGTTWSGTTWSEAVWS